VPATLNRLQDALRDRYDLQREIGRGGMATVYLADDIKHRRSTYYNFCRVHQTLTKANRGIHTTPAMVAGLTDQGWTVKDMIAMMNPETARIG
jgi:hypothetical protein